GEVFSVRGPLNLDRPPQGYPVTIVAGASGAGRHLAAKYADISFTAQFDIVPARAFYADVKSLVAAEGRDPSHVLVMPGLVPVVGATKALARKKFEQLQRYVSIEEAIPLLSFFIGHDVSKYPLDEPLPALEASDAMKSRTELLQAYAQQKKLSLRELAMDVAAARGHLLVIGTPIQIADTMQEWFETSAADGFNILPPFFPGGLDDFVNEVVPLLQTRGLFRSDYDHSTLRGHLGLPIPDNRRVETRDPVPHARRSATG
ncbi:MAG: LLM class flavin-dependent oxidoreductase, partial [Alphaproteobacteria bacterium]